MMRVELPDMDELLARAKILMHELHKIKLDLCFSEQQDFGTQSGESYDSGIYRLECFDHLIKDGLDRLKLYPDGKDYGFLRPDGSHYSTTYVHIDDVLIARSEVTRLEKVESQRDLEVAWQTRPHD